LGVHIEHAGATDVTITNPRDILYIRGNETTDGSIRFHFIGEPGETEARVEARGLLEPGVWNKTGLIFAQGSINLGTNLRLSAAGEFLRTFLSNSFNPVTVPRAVYGHMPYTDGKGSEPNPIAGTTGFPIMPVLNDQRAEDIFDPVQTGQDTDNNIVVVFPPLENRIMTESRHRTGTQAATSDVQVTFRDAQAKELLSFMIPQSLMAANTNFSLLFDDFGFGGTGIFQEFDTATGSDLISLATNAAGDVLTNQIFFPQATEDIILEEFVITNDVSLLFPGPLEGEDFGSDPSFIVGSRFP